MANRQGGASSRRSKCTTTSRTSVTPGVLPSIRRPPLTPSSRRRSRMPAASRRPMSAFPSASSISMTSSPTSTRRSRRLESLPWPPEGTAGRGAARSHPARPPRSTIAGRQTMSIALPRGLPARRTLVAEGVEVLSGNELRRWGRRPLRLCLVNLMPNKIVTETQIARLLGATSMMVELTLCVPDSYRSKTAPADHMASFYRPWTHVRDEHFDGLIVTGAPVEALPFEDVTYWSDLCAIFDWARARPISSLYICWAAQAALYHFHGVPKHRLPEKMFGVFRHRVTNNDSHLLRGFGDEFPAPVSRHTEVRAADLPAQAGLTVLAVSADAGLCVV